MFRNNDSDEEQEAMDSQQCSILEDTMCRMDSISGWNIYKGDGDDTANTTSSRG